MWNRTHPLVVAALVVTIHLFWRPAVGVADGLRLMAELEYVDTNFSTEDTATHEVTDSDLTRISQLYHLDVSRALFPNLLLDVGGVMDVRDTETSTEGETLDSGERTTRPYLDLRLATPRVQAAAGYRKTEVKDTTTGVTTVRNYVDEYTGELNLRPAELPQVAMSYTRLLASDDPETSDSMNELFTLRGRYDWRELAVNYDHSRTKSEERIADSTSTTQVDTGRLTYGHGFLDNRLDLTLGSRINRAVVTTAGSGETRVPTSSPGSPFFFSGAASAISNPLGLTPDDFDPFVAGSNALNIGQAGGLVPVGIGLDFGFPTEVDTLYVPIRPDDAVPNLAGEVAAVAGSFTWRLFVSDDQETWREANIAAVTFDIVFGRFQVTFAQPQNTRFLHLVVTPSLVPTAPRNIYLAGIESLRTLPGGSEAKLRSLDQNYNLRLQYRVSDRTTVGYDLGYQQRNSTPDDQRRTTLNNGLNGHHRFNDVFTGTARFVHSDTWETDRPDQSSDDFTAALRANYLPTLSQTLTYNAIYSTDPEGDSHTHSVVLRNNAELYEGWNMNLDLGGSRGDLAQGGDVSSTFVRVGTNLVPNRKTNVDLHYAAMRNSHSGRDATLRQQGDVHVFIVPFPTLSLSAGVSVDDDQARDEPATVLQNYSVSWLPFPDGTLQFSVAYSEFLRNDGEETKSFSPTAQWQVFRGGQVTLIYSTGTVETVDEARDFSTLTANLRLIY